MEVLVVSATQSYADGIGVMNASQSVNASLGVSANSGADFITGDGNFYINNSSQGSVASGATNGAIVGMAVDLDNGNIWFAVNGGLWNNSALANPVLNIGGISIASLGTPLYVGAYAQSGNTPTKQYYRELWRDGLYLHAASWIWELVNDDLRHRTIRPRQHRQDS